MTPQDYLRRVIALCRNTLEESRTTTVTVTDDDLDRSCTAAYWVGRLEAALEWLLETVDPQPSEPPESS